MTPLEAARRMLETGVVDSEAMPYIIAALEAAEQHMALIGDRTRTPSVDEVLRSDRALRSALKGGQP